ncbi:preprotein translocase subunit SecE [Agrococcus lahaulensis]|uniref:preprotein translocase subunit SecE n=1 Tax=Agrococcus lahaulensis TaxID=341722 RepID=UPI0004167375|nr:preprotein translocase subunit SecE [Agrococcus lahaulensis]
MAENAIEEAPRTRAGGSRNPFLRLWTFLKEVLVELRKVVTPTRKELIRYTLVVLVFVVFMMLLVSGLDLLFGSLVGWVFGDIPLFGLA